MRHPISFSIPEEKIISEIPLKNKLMSAMLPGNAKPSKWQKWFKWFKSVSPFVPSTYKYSDEKSYYTEYQNSIFATTKKKAGWDCLRHYEILANGCIPYFPDIKEMPTNTMTNFPKKLLYKTNKLYEKYKNMKIDDLSKAQLEELHHFSDILLQYTRQHLTTRKIAEYVLEKTQHKNISSILFLSGNTEPDYLRCLTLHGFKTIFGKRCHDFPKISHLYKDQKINYNNLYGKGFSYSDLLNEELHQENVDELNGIKNKKYDIIVYGNYHRGMPYYDIVKKYYKNQ
jgi:hypothetical protein